MPERARSRRRHEVYPPHRACHRCSARKARNERTFTTSAGAASRFRTPVSQSSYMMRDGLRWHRGGSATMTERHPRPADRFRPRRRLSLTPTAIGILLMCLAMLVPGSALVRAQTDTFAIGTVLRVANTDGEALNLRAGPSSDGVVVARLAPDEAVTVIAAPQIIGQTRWIPVQTSGGQLGWVSEQYLATFVVAVPVASPTPEVALVE